MIELDRLRADVLAMYPAVVDRVGTDLVPTRRETLERSRERLAAGRYAVVVCGEFRRGKSSLLNALVGRPGLFPVDVDVTTATICTLAYGEPERAVVRQHAGEDGIAPEPREVALGEVARFASEQADPENKNTVERVEMTAAVESLRSGLVLVDTPGVGSENAAHSAATRAFLPYADAILFVGSAVQPLGTVELGFLAQALDVCPVVVSVLTKLDMVVSAGPVVEEARQRIAKVAGTDPGALVVVAVSAHRRAASVAEPDPEIAAELAEDSGFAELEDVLWAGLAATCGAAQIDTALDALDGAVADGRAPLDNELAALAGDGELGRVDAELREARTRIKDLADSRSRWRDRLRNEIEVGSRAVADDLEADFDALRADFEHAVASDAGVEDPNRVAREASRAMDDAAHRAREGLTTLLTGLATRYAAETAVPLTATGVGGAERDFGVGDLRARGAAAPERYTAFRRVWGGLGAGAGAGALVGSVVPVIGTAFGALAGAVAGWIAGRGDHKRRERERWERESRKALREQVLPKIQTFKQRAAKDLGRDVRDATTALVGDLDTQLKAAGESLQQSAGRLAATRERTVAEQTGRRAELDADRARFDSLRASLDDLRSRTVKLRGERGIG